MKDNYPGFDKVQLDGSDVFHLSTRSSVLTICGLSLSKKGDEWILHASLEGKTSVEDGMTLCKNCRASILSKKRNVDK